MNQLIESLVSESPADLVIFESRLDLDKALDSVILRKLERIIGTPNIVKAITFITLRYTEASNVGKKFTPNQAALFAVDLLDIFQYETLEDVLLMFNWVRQGKIGDGKDFKLDSQTVFNKWVPQYLELKSYRRDHIRNKKPQHTTIPGPNEKLLPHPKAPTSNTPHPEVKKKIAGVGSRLKDKLATPEQYTTPIQRRDIYLNILTETAAKAPLNELKMAVKNLTGNPKEQDALKIIQKEIDKRV